MKNRRTRCTKCQDFFESRVVIEIGKKRRNAKLCQDCAEISRGDGAISLMFGLTYAAYLVIPRVVLESQPHKWQNAFANLMEDMNENTIEKFEPEAGYRVQPMRHNGKFAPHTHNEYRRNSVAVKK